MVKTLAAITTPFGTDGEIDLDAFEAHLRWLEESGLDGVFVGGTTGEGVLLEDDEIEALTQRAVSSAGSLRVIAQIGRPSTQATVRLLDARSPRARTPSRPTCRGSIRSPRSRSARTSSPCSRPPATRPRSSTTSRRAR